MDKGKAKEISVYLDRIEELEDGGAEAVLLIDEGGEEYSGEIIFPAEFLPEGSSDGDYLTIKISADEEKTQAAFEEAKNLLKARSDDID